MSFLYSLKKNVGREESILYGIIPQPTAQNMYMGIKEGYTSNIFAEILPELNCWEIFRELKMKLATNIQDLTNSKTIENLSKRNYKSNIKQTNT
jgi:hypothetical protein